ncbi:ribosomal RNA small subunit methyltransferase A [Patescibacteria group bacterium]|nr:ribosomal RNA small subunit methyltransferase A [Patescibacteria group bacterium]MBU1500632.1 ribosomal RNA small subunit methyltransferase A [Patescibacteria group bacterium]MBU2080525.1 ribosomal RNA small subunit methyltransferase A [Patescibacteria group bacterium]MBU2123670.1 ribosomal RNA small subunit methyltransferase A [Patescibacteria group bacterium]MBU2194526.1 ribosomal RNA small subunit methyltransferase A [Patescibacteria group bacterium]
MFAKKSLGQNFLMHRQTGERIVLAADLPKEAVVLEIGPGTGMLTRELLKRTARVVAVEADYSLIPQLEETFAEEIAEGKLQLISADIRAFSAEIIGSDYHVVANIPYYITGELIRQFLTEKHQPKSMTLLVQKEVAVRIARSKKESLLSLSVKVYGTPSYCFTVPRGAFMPAPNVDSAVLSIKGISRSSFTNPTQEQQFFACIRAAFAHKRKRLAKNLEELWGREEILSSLTKCGIPIDARAEDLSLSDWLSVSKTLS